MKIKKYKLNITDDTGELKVAKNGSVATDFNLKVQNSAADTTSTT